MQKGIHTVILRTIKNNLVKTEKRFFKSFATVDIVAVSRTTLALITDWNLNVERCSLLA